MNCVQIGRSVESTARFVQIELTTRCNFKCGFCAGRHLPEADMSLTTLKYLLSSLPSLCHIELQGEGEPMVHPDFLEVLALIRERFPKVKISLITNGSLLNQETIEHLIEYRVNCIMISLGTVDAEHFQAIRGGRFSRVERGVQSLVERLGQAPQSDLKIGLAVTLLKETYKDFSKIAQWYRKMGLNGGILVQPLQTMSAYRKFYGEREVRNLMDGVDRKNFNYIIASDRFVQGPLKEHRLSSSFYAELLSSVDRGTTSCPWLESGLYVSAEGVAASCCFIKDSSRYGFGPIDELGSHSFLGKQEALKAALSSGETPMQCVGCGIANRIKRIHTDECSF